MNRLVFPTTLLLVFMVCATGAQAAGWGLSGYYGAGDFSLTSKPYLFPETKASGSLQKTGAALVYDSNLAKDETFGCRISLGVENSALSSDKFKEDETLTALNMDALLVIGLMSTPSFRMWVGPELRIGTASGSGGDFTKDANPFVIGFGAALGVNVHLGQTWDLSLSLGGRAENYNQGNNQFGAEKTLKGDASYGYAVLTLFYRTEDDAYSSK